MHYTIGLSKIKINSLACLSSELRNRVKNGRVMLSVRDRNWLKPVPAILLHTTQHQTQSTINHNIMHNIVSNFLSLYLCLQVSADQRFSKWRTSDRDDTPTPTAIARPAHCQDPRRTTIRLTGTYTLHTHTLSLSLSLTAPRISVAIALLMYTWIVLVGY